MSALARGLQHPRWLHVLPNGDVLVAESNAPKPPPGEERKGIKAFVMKKVMARAGAGVPSPDRIVLLRDANGDGQAELRPGRALDVRARHRVHEALVVGLRCGAKLQHQAAAGSATGSGIWDATPSAR